MLTQIREWLAGCGIEQYSICCIETEATESYSVGHRPDIVRYRHSTEYRVTVYDSRVEDGAAWKGESVVRLYPDMSEEEGKRLLLQGKSAAGSVRIPDYPFPAPVTEAAGSGSADSGDPERIRSWFYQADEQQRLLYLELFLEQERRHLVTSWGTDVRDCRSSVRGEFTAGCSEPERAEVYQEFNVDQITASEVQRMVREASLLAEKKARAAAMTRSGRYNLILEGRYAHELFRMYLMRSDAAAIASGNSDYAVGRPVSPGASPDTSTTASPDTSAAGVPDLWLTAVRRFSEEGIRLVSRELIRGGVLQCVHGAAKDTGRLKLPPIGRYDGLRVDTGTESEEKWFEEPYFRPLLFSDFQMVGSTGVFFGETRLAEVFDGRSTRLVRGGSVRGNLLELQDRMRCSEECCREHGYEGPRAVLLPEVQVSGPDGA